LTNHANQVVKTIINELQNEYETNWIKVRVPRLMTIIKNQMKNNETFQQALTSYKTKNNSISTDAMMHVLSNQILWYYDDISFLTNRNKYDFQ
jgi:hypothetical protein